MTTTPSRPFQVARNSDRQAVHRSVGIGDLFFKVTTADSNGAFLVAEIVHHAKGGPPRLGQFLIALDPMHFAGAGFAARMTELVGAIAEDGARLPGDRRLTLRARAAREGLVLADDLHAQIRALAN